MLEQPIQKYDSLNLLIFHLHPSIGYQILCHQLNLYHGYALNDFFDELELNERLF